MTYFLRFICEDEIRGISVISDSETISRKINFGTSYFIPEPFIGLSRIHHRNPNRQSLCKVYLDLQELVSVCQL